VEDSPATLLKDMAEDPATRAILDKQLQEEAEDFIASCLQFALKLKHAPDAWAGRRALIDAKVWMHEANKQLDKEIETAKEKRELPRAGRRGGV
jgi:hypothetical protein